MKTIEAAKIIKANTTSRDNAIIAKQGMTGVEWYHRHSGIISKEVEDIADDIISGIEYGENEKSKIRKIAGKIMSNGKNPAAVALGRLGRAAMTEAQAEAARENGKLGGRPRKKPIKEKPVSDKNK